jgi:Fic family protein
MESDQNWIWQLPQWPALTYNRQRKQAALGLARASQSALIAKAMAIGLENLQDQICDTLTQEALTTSAIEGEMLNIHSVRSSLARRLGLDTHGAPVPEAERNLEGLIDVMQDASLHTDAPLTLDRLCQWHGALFPDGYSGLRRIVVGSLRTGPMDVVSGPMGREKVHYSAPPAEMLSSAMSAFLNWFNNAQPKVGTEPMDGMERAALSHLWFETLHPFDDGNGRMGRAILQLALGQEIGQAGRIITVSRQIESSKKQYYQALELAQRSASMDVTGWMVWMLEQMALAAEHALKTIEISLQRIRFNAAMAKVPLNERQRKLMHKLLEAGPKGFVGGMSTRKHQSMSGISTPTATRDLLDLHAQGLLTRRGEGRSTRYYPAIDGWADN